MAKNPRERKVYIVGDTAKGADFSPMEIENLQLKLIAWFRDDRCDRNFDDPESAANEIIQQCLTCTKKDGDTWNNAPHEFTSRIKVKAAYDMTTGKGIAISGVKHPMAVRRVNREAELKAKEGVVEMITPALVEFDMEEFRAEREAAIYSQFPELNNPLHQTGVERLSMLYAQQTLLNKQMSMGIKPTQMEDMLKHSDSLGKQINAQLVTLDIHPESLRKRSKERIDGSVSDFVAFCDSDDNLKALEKLWTLQEILQLWYMCKHDNGAKTGPQISEVELWHMTRTRPFSFTCRCGQKYDNIVQGFTPKALRDYLRDNGVLIEVPAIPHIITREDLVGINEYIDALPDDQEAPLPSEDSDNADTLFGR